MAVAGFEYNNPAGRIYQNFKAIIAVKGHPIPSAQFAGALGVPDNWEAIFTAMIDMRRDFELLEETINEIKDSNASKHRLWYNKLDDIKNSINSFSCNSSNSNCDISITASAVNSLEFIAADLAEEEQTSRDDLEHLRMLCDELKTEIHKCDDLHQGLKKWLLDLVRLMRDGIDRYKVRGSRGLRKQFHEMLGSLMTHEEYQKEVKQKSPTIWLKIMNGLESMNKMGNFVERGSKALGFVMKAIEYLPNVSPKG